MNRADLMHSVLRDGTWHTRRDVFERVGFMLTNNAASELRARGLNVEHRRSGRIDEYRILATDPREDVSPSLETVFVGAFTTAGDASSVAEPSEQLSFGSATGRWPYASSESRAA